MNAAALTGISTAVAAILSTFVGALLQRRRIKADAAQVTTDTAIEAAGGVVAMLKIEMDRLAARLAVVEQQLASANSDKRSLEYELQAQRQRSASLERRVTELERLLDEAGIDHRPPSIG